MGSSHLEVLVHAVTAHFMFHLMRNITGERNKSTFGLQNKQVRTKNCLGRNHIPLSRHITNYMIIKGDTKERQQESDGNSPQSCFSLQPSVGTDDSLITSNKHVFTATDSQVRTLTGEKGASQLLA